MKKLILVVFSIFNVSFAMGASLPQACEDLAWKFAQVKVAAEAYADIVDVRFDKTKSEYSALVRPNETSWYQMKFRYNEFSDDQCLLLNLNVFYR